MAIPRKFSDDEILAAIGTLEPARPTLTSADLSTLSADQAFALDVGPKKRGEPAPLPLSPPVLVSPVTGLPRPTQGFGVRVWMTGICCGVLVSALLAACSNANQKAAEAEKAKAAAIPLSFDPADATRTIRWLIERSVPLGKARYFTAREQENNPLRKDYFNAVAAEEQKWNQLLVGLADKEVDWSFRVGTITTEAVVICSQWYRGQRSAPDTVGQCRVYLSFVSPDRESDQPGYGLVVGRDISKEDATALNRDDLIRAKCRIVKVAVSLQDNGDAQSVLIVLEPPISASR